MECLGKDRDEGVGQRPFAKEATEEVRQSEGNDKGGLHSRGAKVVRHDLLAYQSRHAADAGHHADDRCMPQYFMFLLVHFF